MNPMPLSSSFNNYERFVTMCNLGRTLVHPFYGHTPIYLSTYLLMDILTTPDLAVLSKTAAIIYVEVVFCFVFFLQYVFIFLG